MTTNHRPPFRASIVPVTLLVMSALTGIAYGSTTRQPAQSPGLYDVRVNQTTTADQQEPTISVDPTNPNNILSAAKDWRTGPKQVWDYRSTDGGKSWVDGYPNLLPSELPTQSDPVVAYDASGAAYLSELGYNQSDFSVGGVFVARSNDKGATWQPAVELSGNSEQYFNDKEWLTVDKSNNATTKGYVYVTWTLFTTISPTRETAQIVISRSTDGGNSFSMRQPVSPSKQDAVQGSYPVVGPNGDVYVLYFGGPGALDSERDEGSSEAGGSGATVQALQTDQQTQDSLFVARSTDAGATFGPPVRVAPVVAPPSPLPNSAFRMFVLPVLAADPHSGALYATWNDAASGRTDVLVAASTDDGATWGAPRRVNDDPTSRRTDHFFPTAAVGQDGVLHVLWLDRRDDPSNHLYRPYYSESTDSGKNFSANTPLSASMSDPDIGFEGTLIGDYISMDLSADGSSFSATWVDTRGGDQDIYFTALTNAAELPPEPLTTPTTRGEPIAVPSPQPLTGFSDGAFITAWERPDRAVLTGAAQRPWVWGPASFASANEPYKQGQNGQRQVLYFDKARMEINNAHLDPSAPNYVTNGLLVVELISGSIQVGNNEFEAPRPPANIPVAGDANSVSAITYASLAPVASLHNDNRASDRTGQDVTAALDKAGNVTVRGPRGTPLIDASQVSTVKIAKFEPILGHNIPDVFWSFMSASGPIFNGNFHTYTDGQILDWISALGYPITEPYWITVPINGVPKSVLVQAFQRRVLTYVADNPPGWQVEMANVGRQAFDWRYGK